MLPDGAMSIAGEASGHSWQAYKAKDLPVLRIDDDLQALAHVAQVAGHGMAGEGLLDLGAVGCALLAQHHLRHQLVDARKQQRPRVLRLRHLPEPGVELGGIEPALQHRPRHHRQPRAA